METISYLMRQLFGRGKKKKIFALGLILGYILGSKYPNQGLNKAINLEVIKEKALILLSTSNNSSTKEEKNIIEELEVDPITIFSKVN